VVILALRIALPDLDARPGSRRTGTIDDAARDIEERALRNARPAIDAREVASMSFGNVLG
jgi:hypothetical protein